MVSFGVVPTDAATKPRAKSTKPATAGQAPGKRAVYSAARSQSRKLTLARARAVAMAREMADTVLPRYKVDASGDLVPDVRAAAAIIYNPETNEVLWEENSQDQRCHKRRPQVVLLEPDSRHDIDGNQHCQRRDEPALNEFFQARWHGQSE